MSGSRGVAERAESPDAIYERLQARRQDYERAVVGRFRGTFGRADAEDLVSSALERVLTTAALPEPHVEEAWFHRVVFNLAIDEIRRQKGRPRGKPRGGGLQEVVLLSELSDRGWEPEDVDRLADPERVLEELEEPVIRAEAMARTREVLDELDPQDVRLLFIRHVEMPEAGRQKCAGAAGMTVDAWRHRYGRAWRRFIDAVAAAEPTDHCRPVRELVGALDAGALSKDDAQAARARVDVHVLECTACRVFARESYRILVLTPAAPASAVGVERLIEQGSAFVSRNGESLATGGAIGGGAGILALLGVSSLSGALKVLAVVCTVSVTAAGVCGGVVATIEFLDGPDKAKVAESRRKPRTRSVSVRPTTTPAAPVATSTRPAASQKRTTTGTRRRSTASRKTTPPAAVASGATGREFAPVPAQSQSQPAPAPTGGGGEFTP